MRFYIALFLVLILLSVLGVVPARAEADRQGGPVYLPFVGQSGPPEPAVSPAIVGGQDADPGEWPWQVLLLIDDTYLCGGSIVHPQWVLTAAHCVLKDVTVWGVDPYPPSALLVVAGEHDLQTAEGREQARNVAQVVVHPSYNPYTADSDLALLKLSKPVTLGSAADVVPLLTSPDDDPLAAPGTLATVTGWGATSTEGTASMILQEVSVPIITNSVCNQAFGGAITDNMICAGYEAGGKDTCYGDSGGPLVVPDGAGGWKLAGVTSFGPRECATKYGGYTRVSRFTDWIGSWVWQVTITDFAPQSGPAKSQVTITGKGFAYATSVQFGGVDAPFTIVSDTKILATVPDNAVSGPIRVDTPYDTAVSAHTFHVEYPVTLTVTGPGTGYVTGAGGAINCNTGQLCSADIVDGDQITLRAWDGPEPEYVFAGWTGDCGGTAAACSVLVDASKTITAVFSPLTPTLTVSVSSVDGGNGRVTSKPAGIDCGRACAAGFAASSTVKLTAKPDADSVFSHWAGACAGEGASCQVTMIGAQSATAIFQPDTYPITVALAGNGAGRVTSFPAGIDCVGHCSVEFATGSMVNLTANADAGSAFVGWTGACSGAGQTCAVTVDAAKSVTARFEHIGVYLPAMLRQRAASQ